MKICIIALDPKTPWKLERIEVDEKLISKISKNKDQMKLRNYWRQFCDLLEGELTTRGHEVKTQIMCRWDVTPEYVNRLDADLVFIPHTSSDVFITSKPVFFYMQVMQGWLFTADPKGWGSLSSRYPANDYIKGDPHSGVFDNYKEILLASNSSKFPQKEGVFYKDLMQSGEVPLFEDYIFFPCQIPHDESLAYHSDVKEIDVVKSLVNWCNKNKVYCVFKRHPANLKSMKLLEEIAKGKYIYWSDASIHDLIKHSKAVYTINSGVGFEAMLHCKPVVTFGKTEYDQVSIKSGIDNLYITWKKVLKWEKTKNFERYKAFYDWFCRKYAVDLLDPESSRKRIKEICDEAEAYVHQRTGN